VTKKILDKLFVSGIIALTLNLTALYIFQTPPQTPPTQDRIYRAFLSGHAPLSHALGVKNSWDFLFLLARNPGLVNQINLLRMIV